MYWDGYYGTEIGGIGMAEKIATRHAYGEALAEIAKITAFILCLPFVTYG